MHFSRLILFPLCFLISQVTLANADAEDLYQQADVKYDELMYEHAINLLQKTIELSPATAKYHHLLGKSYGRMAEKASWLKALSYAKKTRKSLERAVELDAENVDAVRDLVEFYRQAPGFLGGSDKKAKELEARLVKLDNSNQAQILQN